VSRTSAALRACAAGAGNATQQWCPQGRDPAAVDEPEGAPPERLTSRLECADRDHLQRVDTQPRDLDSVSSPEADHGRRNRSRAAGAPLCVPGEAHDARTLPTAEAVAIAARTIANGRWADRRGERASRMARSFPNPLVFAATATFSHCDASLKLCGVATGRGARYEFPRRWLKEGGRCGCGGWVAGPARLRSGFRLELAACALAYGRGAAGPLEIPIPVNGGESSWCAAAGSTVTRPLSMGGLIVAA
jgi:hypothetical protein